MDYFNPEVNLANVKKTVLLLPRFFRLMGMGMFKMSASVVLWFVFEALEMGVIGWLGGLAIFGGIILCMTGIGYVVGVPLIIGGIVWGLGTEPISRYATLLRQRLKARNALEPSWGELLAGGLGFMLLASSLWLIEPSTRPAPPRASAPTVSKEASKTANRASPRED